MQPVVSLLVLVVLAGALQLANGWRLMKPQIPVIDNLRKVNAKAAAVLLTASTLAFAPAYIPPAHALNDALEGATRAMMQKSSKEDAEDTRPFDSLPAGAKKRRALSMCKDSTTRKGAGYQSEASCTKAVLEGNYAIAFPAASFSSSKLLQTSSSTTTSTSSSKSSSAPAQRPQREKQQDLSDLSPAAKKRRSLAACKKKDVQKYLRQSESKCTSDVINGEYDSVIEAIEYGY